MRLGGLGVHHAPYQVPVPDHQEQVHQHGWQVDVPVPVTENNAQVPSWQEQTPVHHARLADQLVHVHKQRKHVHAPVPDVQMLTKEQELFSPPGQASIHKGTFLRILCPIGG